MEKSLQVIRSYVDLSNPDNFLASVVSSDWKSSHLLRRHCNESHRLSFEVLVSFEVSEKFAKLRRAESEEHLVCL